MKCNICKGELWVCEDHSDKPWNDGECCGGAGMPCPECNNESTPKLPEGHVTIWSRLKGWVQ